MDKENSVFSEEYAIESSTDVPSKSTEEEHEEHTVSGQIRHYDKSRPYRVILRAKEIKQ